MERNQGCIRLPNSCTEGHAVGHRLLARSFPQNRQLRLWRKRCLFFNAARMQGASRAPAIVWKKDVRTTAKVAGGPIEVIINGTPKIIISGHLHTSVFHSSSSQQHLKTSTQLFRKFPKHEVLMCMDANTTQVDAVPNNVAAAHDEERTTYFFVNIMTKSGLVAQNTRLATRAPQEEMYTRKEWDTHEIVGKLLFWNRQITFRHQRQPRQQVAEPRKTRS